MLTMLVLKLLLIFLTMLVVAQLIGMYVMLPMLKEERKEWERQLKEKGLSLYKGE